VAAALLSVAGVATAIYQHVVAARSDSCALTLADRVIGGLRLVEFWPAMFEATARCDEANLPWLGVPFALWGALTFLITASGSLLALQGTNRQA
jgi:disulfide bond formation protein DsbB